jgi:hypothetical protein
MGKTVPVNAVRQQTALPSSDCPNRYRQMNAKKFILPLDANKDWGCTHNSGFGRKSPGKALGAKTYVGYERPPKFDGSLRTGLGQRRHTIVQTERIA